MNVAVEIPGTGREEVEIDDGTYGDLLTAVGFSPQEASVLVDGQPVPDDQPVEAEEVTILRLIAGG